MISDKIYDWKRFWCPRDGVMDLSDDGFLVDPETDSSIWHGSEHFSLESLSNIQCLILLGEPGIGKTTALEHYRSLGDLNQNNENIYIFRDLDAYSDENRLINDIFSTDVIDKWKKGSHNLIIYLDGLDECRLQIPPVSKILSNELSKLKGYKESLYFRISCRTALWPPTLEENLKNIFGKESIKILELAPLRKKDIELATKEENIDSDIFLDEVLKLDVTALANKPITLRFLINSFIKSKKLPTSRLQLYKEGCELLCKEQNQSRIEKNYKGKLSSKQRITVAARIAAITTLSNKAGIILNTSQYGQFDNFLKIEEVAQGYEEVEHRTFEITEQAIYETISTGLFTSRGVNLMGWAHKTYQEYLSAYYFMMHNLNSKQILNFIEHPHDPGRIIPQLKEVTGWLCSLLPDIQKEILDREPDLLLGSDVLDDNYALKSRLVDKILKLFDQKLIYLDYHDKRLGKLYHPGLSKQLRSYINSYEVQLGTRLLAICIAGACEHNDVQELLVEIARDTSKEIQLRIRAANSLVKNGTEIYKAKLKSILNSDLSNDKQDELKGAILTALWPDHITAKELIDNLTYPKDDKFFGLYFIFYNSVLVKYLHDKDLSVFFKWIISKISSPPDHDAFQELVNQIMKKAWNYIDNPEIMNLFVQTALKRLQGHEPVIGKRLSSDVDPVLFKDNDKRRRLIEALIPLLEDPKESPLFMVFRIQSLITKDDFSWLVEKLAQVCSDKEKAIYAKIIKYIYNYENGVWYNTILETYQKEPFLHKEFASIIDPIVIDSEKARRIKQQYYDESQEELKQREEQKKKRQFIREKILHLLKAFQQDICQNWWLLVRELCLKPDSRYYENEWNGDITKTTGWEYLESEDRELIQRTALKYLYKCDPETYKWLPKHMYDHRAYAGYKALRLILNKQKSEIYKLSSDIWGRWTPSILAYTFFRGEDDDKSHLDLVNISYKNTQVEFLKTLNTLIDRENETGKYVEVTWQVEECWDDNIAELIRNKAFDDRLKPTCKGTLLRQLLSHKEKQTLDKIKHILKTINNKGLENNEFFDILIYEAFVAEPVEIWEFILPIIQINVEIGQRLFLRYAHENQSYEKIINQLSENKLADLFIWLLNQFPIEEDQSAQEGGLVTARIDLEYFRNAIINHLSRKGTKTSVNEVSRIVNSFPQYPFLKSHLLGSRDFMRHKTWHPLEPMEVLELFRNKDSRYIQSGEQLLDLLEESLERLQNQLHAKNSDVVFLWDNVDKTNMTPTPVIETIFSRFIESHFERDIKDIIINREVEIHYRNRTDIKIDAIVRETGDLINDKITAIIEVKGCWNKELKKSMESQLLDEYLNSPDLNYGIYLVGWFYCDRWEKQKGPLKSKSLSEAKEYFEKQAKELTKSGKVIRSVVLDTGLR